MVPIKSVVHLYFFLHKKNPNLSTFFFCFSASVESIQIWPKSGTFEMPVRSLQDGGREKQKKGEKKFQNLFALFPLLFFFFLFVIQHLLAYYFGNLSYGSYYLRFINSEVFSQINHFISQSTNNIHQPVCSIFITWASVNRIQRCKRVIKFFWYTKTFIH